MGPPPPGRASFIISVTNWVEVLEQYTANCAALLWNFLYSIRNYDRLLTLKFFTMSIIKIAHCCWNQEMSKKSVNDSVLPWSCQHTFICLMLQNFIFMKTKCKVCTRRYWVLNIPVTGDSSVSLSTKNSPSSGFSETGPLLKQTVGGLITMKSASPVSSLNMT